MNDLQSPQGVTPPAAPYPLTANASGAPSQARAEDADALTKVHLGEAKRLTRWGIAIILGALVPAGIWLSFAPLSSAVVATGHVKVDLNRRTVQHAEGGTVLQVLVRDGQAVKEGEPLLVLGDVAVDAEKNRLSLRVLAEQASLERSSAEQAGKDRVVFSQSLLDNAARDPRLAEHLRKERQLFEAQREGLTRQVQLLRLQKDKLAEEASALKAQVAKGGDSMRFQNMDLETNRKLLGEGFISPTRIAQLEGAAADYGMKIEEKHADIARAQQRAVEIDLRIQALQSQYTQQASDQRRASAAQISELEQELRKSADAAARQVIRAPTDGVIIDLKYATAGAVITPREVIASVVPSETRLLTEARIRPEDVSRVLPGQAADIQFTAFSTRSTPLVAGKVIYLSPDRLTDKANDSPYYAVLIEADPASLAKAGDLRLQAGMPAEVYVKGQERTPLDYLMAPLTQALRHAARER